MSNITFSLSREYIDDHARTSTVTGGTHRCDSIFVKKLTKQAIEAVALGKVVSTDGALSFLLRKQEVRDELTIALADYQALENVITDVFGANSMLYKKTPAASHASVQKAIDDRYTVSSEAKLLIAIFLIDLLSPFELMHDALDQSVLIDYRSPDVLDILTLREEVTDRLLVDNVIHALKTGNKVISQIELPNRINVRSYMMELYAAFRDLSSAFDDAAYRLMALDDVLSLVYRRLAHQNDVEQIYGRVEQLSYLDAFVKNATLCRLSFTLRHHTPSIAATEMRGEAERIHRALLSMARYEATNNVFGRTGCSVYNRLAAKEVAAVTIFSAVRRSLDVDVVRAISIPGLNVDEVRNESNLLGNYIPKAPEIWSTTAVRDAIVTLEESNARATKRAPVACTYIDVEPARINEMAMCSCDWEVQNDGVVVYFANDSHGRVAGSAANTFGTYVTMSAVLVCCLYHPEHEPEFQLDKSSSLPIFKKKTFISNVSTYYPQNPQAWTITASYVYGDLSGKVVLPWLGRTPFNPTHLRLGAGSGWSDILSNWATVARELGELRGTKRKSLLQRRFFEVLGMRWLEWYHRDAVLQSMVQRAAFSVQHELGGEEYHYMFDSYCMAAIIASVIASVMKVLYTASSDVVNQEVIDFLDIAHNDVALLDAIALRWE